MPHVFIAEEKVESTNQLFQTTELLKHRSKTERLLIYEAKANTLKNANTESLI